MKMFISMLWMVALLAIAGPTTVSATTIYSTILLGSNEVPPNASPATGTILVTLSGNSLTVNESFSGLIGGPASAAHIHCCGPVGVIEPVAVPFPGFPAATGGTYMNSFDLSLASTYNPDFVTANGGTVASAEAAFIAGLNSFQTYANIHNTTFPVGEIRGQLAQVPEAATIWLLLLGFTATLGLTRKGHRSVHPSARV